MKLSNMGARNILLIMTDQLRYDALSCHGNSICKTPNIDKLAKSGMDFVNAFTPCGLCSPARASLLTGRLPHRHGVITNVDQGHTASELPADEVTFAQILGAAGYGTGYVGKWHVGVEKGPAQWGFSDCEPQTRKDYFSGFACKRITYEDMITSRVHDNDFVLAARRNGDDLQDDTGYCQAQAIALLDKYAESGSPFFLRVDFSAPHPPYFVPGRYDAMYDPAEIELDDTFSPETGRNKPHVHALQPQRWGTDRLDHSAWRRIIARYYALVTMVDNAVGCIMSQLAELGLAEDTMVIFTTDHGDATGSRNMYDKGYCMYDEQYHIPLIMSGPGIEPKTCSQDWVSLVDLMPTIVEAAGCALPQTEIDGISLLPTLTSGKCLDRDSIFAQFFGMQYGLTTIRMVRDENYKFVFNGNDRPELYDLQRDPLELNNIADQPGIKDVQERMREKLLNWMRKTEDPVLKTMWGRAAFDPTYKPPPDNPWFA